MTEKIRFWILLALLLASVGLLLWANSLASNVILH